MAGEKIQGQQSDIQRQDERTDAYSESILEKEAAHRVMPEKDNEDDAEIHEIAVQILKNKRELGLAGIAPARFFRHCATRRIKKESPVISFAIVIAGDAESERAGKNQERRRKRPVVM